MKTQPSAILFILATSAIILSACGGGGGTGDTGDTAGAIAPPAGIDTSTLQGRWVTASGASPGYTALVVPDSTTTNTATAWLLAQDASRLVKVSATSGQSANGKSYDLANPGSTATDIASGTYTANLSVSPNSISFANVLGASLSLTQSDPLRGAVAYADAVGTWKASAGAVDVTWTLSGTGALSGSSTSGCRYSGSATTPTAVKLYRISFTETCSATSNVFAGIASLNTEGTRLTVVTTTNGDARGSALFFVKQ